MPQRKAIYAASFDPITNGHLWMIKTGLELFDRLIILVANNPSKKTLFTQDQRHQMVREVVDGLPNGTAVDVLALESTEYAVDLGYNMGANFLLRGIRNVADFEYELTLRRINADICPNVETVFLTPPRELAEISSSAVKMMAGPKGWEQHVKKLVPVNVFEALCGAPGIRPVKQAGYIHG